MNRVLPVCGLVAGLLVLADSRPGSAQTSPYVALTDKAPVGWSLAPAQVDTKILTDRDYKLSVVPKDAHRGTLLVRGSADHGTWLAPGTITAKKDGTVFAIVRTKYDGRVTFSAAQTKQLIADGWEEVEDEAGTTYPGNENWEWAAFKKPIKKGDIDLPLKSLKWSPRTAVLFVFK